MRGSDVSRRSALVGLLASSGMAMGQSWRVGRSSAFVPRLWSPTVDLSVREAVRVYVGVANGANYPTVLRWQDRHRRKLVIRNPSDSGTSFQIGTESGAPYGSNAYTPAYSMSVVLGTLAPGQEMVITNDQRHILATYTTAANFLYLEAEIAAS